MNQFSILPTESTLPSPLLVVEDEPLIRKRLEGILRNLGYTDDALILLHPFQKPALACKSTPSLWRWWTWACPTAMAST